MNVDHSFLYFICIVSPSQLNQHNLQLWITLSWMHYLSNTPPPTPMLVVDPFLFSWCSGCLWKIKHGPFGQGVGKIEGSGESNKHQEKRNRASLWIMFSSSPFVIYVLSGRAHRHTPTPAHQMPLINILYITDPISFTVQKLSKLIFFMLSLGNLAQSRDVSFSLGFMLAFWYN